jgi:radical SAM superfamily enzyme YgiQ (UPF0313 family)
MRLVLASSPVADSPEAVPLGVLCIAAAIRSVPDLGEIETILFEGQTPRIEAGTDPEIELASRIASREPDAVGLSVFSWNREVMVRIAREIKKTRPNVVIFAGGPEATAEPVSLINEAGLDFAIAGEGESASRSAMGVLLAEFRRSGTAGRGRCVLAAVTAEALSRIPGVVLPDTAADRAAGVKAQELDSGDLVSPWLSGTADPGAYGGDLIWELARGCPFRCAYCYESKGRSGLRPFPMGRIEAELELFVRSEVRYLFILDPTFDADRDRAAAILDLLRAKGSAIRYKFEVRAELLDRALVRCFAALDCSLQIGLQSSRPETLALVGRPGFDRREFARKTAMLWDAGVTFGLDLIYGLPGDGLRQFGESIDFALGLEPNHLDVFPLALLPGTELAERAVGLGIDADPRPPYLVRSTKELSIRELEEASCLAAACDRFYTAGRAVGWFKAVLAPLRSRPSAFLRSYGEWRRNTESQSTGTDPVADHALCESRVIEAEQLGYLGHAYSTARLGHFLPAVRDLVRLHGAWARALAEGEETELELTYDPEEALGSALSLEAFVKAAEPAPARVRIVPDDDEGARIER